VFGSRLKKNRLAFLPPDLVDERGGNRLLVWRDIPAWSVVDEDLHELLLALDGSRALREVLASRPEWSKETRSITKLLRGLWRTGVLVDESAPAKPDQAPDADERRIENVAINITRACNLRCAFCYNRHDDAGAGEGPLRIEEVTGLLEDALPFMSPEPSLAILGGEPLLAADETIALASWAAKHGLSTIVSTNGTVVDEDFARRARKCKLQVQVSLDGHNADLNDMARGQGSFDRAVAGIRTLVANRAYTIISMVCHQGNLPHLADFYRLALSLGVNEARFIPLKRVGGGLGKDFKPVSIRRLVHTGYSLLCENPDFVKLSGRDGFSILANTCRYSAKRPSCGTGVQTFLLDADGSIYPCLNTNLPEFRVANIRDPGFDFTTVWRESPLLLKVRRVTSVCGGENRCSPCPVKHWCLGGCRGETYSTRGSLSERAYNCTDLRKAILEVMWCLAERPGLVKKAVHIC